MTISSFRPLRFSAILLAIPLLFGAGELRAQSPDWSALLMAPAFPSPFISEWERNPQNLSLTIVHTGAGERQYYLEAVVRESRRGEVARAESPVLFADGLSTTVLNAGDLSSWQVRISESMDVRAAVRSGVVPEGEYEICVRVLSPQRIQLAQDCAHFSVMLPDAPELVFPGRGDPVLTGQPTFQWTPVLLPPAVGTTYRLRVVELLRGQTPQLAMRANRLHHEAEVSGVPFYLYPLDALQLDAGREYAWQIEAVDALGDPLLPGGLRSEVWSFRADRMGGPAVIAELDILPDTLELVPGVARLIGLRSAEIIEDAFAYTLNGRATLEIELPFQARISARLQDLALDKLARPLRVTGGRLVGDLAVGAIPAELRGEHALLDRIAYSPLTGLTVEGKLNLAGETIRLAGEAYLTGSGIYGVLEGAVPGRGSLLALGADPVELRVRTARLTFPSGEVEIGGSLALFGGDEVCDDVVGRIAEGGALSLDAGCVPQRSLPLMVANDRAQLALHTVVGRIEASFADRTLDYDLSLRAGLYLDAAEGEGCTAQLGFDLTPAGLALNDATPRCDPSLGAAALDWLALGLSNLRVDRFGYRPGTGFDFALRVDVAPAVSTVSGFELPAMSDITISRDGLTFPGFDDEAVGRPIDLAGYRLRISRMALAPFTLSWDAWGRGIATGFDFALDLALTMPDLPEPAPSCLAANSFQTKARLTNGRLTARIVGDDGLPLVAASTSADGPETGVDFEPGSCRLALGEGLTLEIERLGGEVEVELAPVVQLVAGAELAGGLELPALLQCSAEPGERLRVGGGLRLGPRGGVSGAVSGVSLPCAMDLGAVALLLRDAELELGGEPGARSVLLTGGASGVFTALRQLSGSSGEGGLHGLALTHSASAEEEFAPSGPAAQAPAPIYGPAPANGSAPARASGSRVTAAAEIVGKGTIALDLLRGEIASGGITFEGPIQLDLPREEPFLSFSLNRARLDRAGLHLDGRNTLNLPGGQRIGTTFNNVVFGLKELRLNAGEIRFDSPFAIDAGLGPDGTLAWRAVADDAPLTIESGARIQLPNAVVLDSDGFRVEGDGGARILFGGEDLADLAAKFSESFALGLEPLGVTDGVIEFRHDGILLAHIDESGFHPNFAQLTLGLIPDRLGLPNVEIAYLELRDSEGFLNVTVAGAAEGDRIMSRPGGVPLVLPALAGPGGEAPRVLAEFELVLDPATNEVIGGSVVATVPENATSPFDLTALGIPFVASQIAYRPNEAGEYELGLAGRLHLLGSTIGEPGSVELRITEGGRLAGEFALAAPHSYALVPGSERLRYSISGLEGSFNVGLLGGARSWRVEHDGRLEVALGEGEHFPVAARLLANQHGLTFSAVESGTPGLFHYFDLDAVRLGLGNLRIPRIEHSPGSGWDFDIDFDLALSFPELGGLEIPGGTGLREIRLGTGGFAIPKLMVGELGGAAFEWGGFSLRPLAFRMEPLHIDLFGAEGGNGKPSDWGFSFDFEIALGALPQGAPLGLGGIRLSALDVGYRGGRLVGTIEPFEFQNPIALPLGLEEMAFNLLALGGKLNDLPELPRIEVDADLSWTLPEFMRCEGGQATTLSLAAAGGVGVGAAGADSGASASGGTNGTGRFSLAGNGSLTGKATGLAPACPIDLGPLALEITTSDLDFAYSPGARGSAELRLDGRARLPGLAVGDTIRAAGSLTLDLIALEVIDGSINVPGPFRWDLPRENPFLRFVIERGRIDADGFTLAGTGNLRLGDDDAPATIGATFNDLTLGLPDFAIRRGDATFANDFAVAVTLDGGALRWAALPASAARPEGDAFRFAIPSGAVLSARGLALSGESSAELAFADSVFSSLTVAFEDDFRVGVEPVGVREGRAGFNYNGAEIAFVDRDGFHPGDIFGLLTVPDTLPLPTRAVAFLELRDPETGRLRVETSSTAEGLKLTGSDLPLVIPALAGGESGAGAGADADRGAGRAPQLTIGSVELVLDPGTFRVIGGELEVTGAAGGPLIDLAEAYGLPLTVNRLRFANEDGEGYRVRVGLGVQLPEILRDLMVALDDIPLDENGFQGEIRLGSYRPDYEPTEAPLAAAELLADEIDARLDGLRIHFGRDEIALAGSFGLALFADSAGNPSPIPFTAEARGGTLGGDGDAAARAAFIFHTHADSIPGGIFSLGFATFEPKPVGEHPGLALRLNDEELAVRFGGELRIPSLGDDFAVTLAGIEVGTKNGVVIPEVELTTEQEFTLFGAAFRLKRFEDAPRDPGLAVRYDGAARVLALDLSGEIEFPFTNQIPRFRGLHAATDGSFSLAYANLLSDTLVIVDDLLTLDQLTIESDSLRVAFGIALPEPLERGGKQQLRLAIAADGGVSGGGSLVLHRSTSDDEGAELGIATVHLRHLDLDLRANDGSAQAAIRAVADFDLMGDDESRINVGWVEGGAVHPGLIVDFTEGVSWRNTRVRDSIFVPVEVMKLTIREVALEAGARARDLVLGLNGTLSLDVDQISGGLDFADLRLTGGLELDHEDFRVTGGHFNIADIISIEVSDFAYSDEPATLQVAEIGMPTESSNKVSRGTREVEVSSFVQLGGKIGIGPGCDGSADDCLFAGGVDLFQFYRTLDGRTSFLVRDARLKAGSMLDMNADLLYREGESKGFELVLGAEAVLLSEYGAAVVGLFDNTETTLRAGMFVRVDAPIPLVPPLTLDGVGGGFFYNPRPAHLDLVRKYADMPDRREGKDLIDPPTGAFTGLLYGSAAIGDKSVAQGRVLLTLSESYGQLQGELELLAGAGFGGKPLASGYADLTVGFKQKFADGNFGLSVDLDPIASGSGEVGFYVYGADAWGIHGDAKVELVRMIDGEASFFVGSAGFMASAEVQAGFDFWIIALRAGMEADVWYQREPVDLGAYISVGAEASLLGGTVSGSGTIRGALLAGGGQSPLIYGGALAKGCVVIVGCATANIWAKFQGGGATGGFGKDPALDEILARANAVREGMRASREAMEQSILEGLPAPESTVLSDEELAKLYRNVAGTALASQKLGNQTTMEYQACLNASTHSYEFCPSSWIQQETAYYNYYIDLVRQNGLPRMSDEEQAGYRAAVATRLTSIVELQDAMGEKLDAIGLNLIELRELAEEPWPESPVGRTSFDDPRTVTSLDADGNEVKTLVGGSGPGFEVDAASSGAIKSELAERQAQTDALLGQLREQIDELEAGSAAVQALLRERGPGSIAAFLELHTDAITAAEEEYARHGDLLFRQKDWFEEQGRNLGRREGDIGVYMSRKSNQLLARDLEVRVRTLAEQRIRVMDDLSGGNRLATFQANFARATPEQLADEANKLGVELWYGLARSGMAAASAEADSSHKWIRVEATNRLYALRRQHRQLTDEVHRLAVRHADLVGIIYDLYDRYDHWLAGAAEAGEGRVAEGGAADQVRAERARVASRMTQLERSLRVPTVALATVTSKNLGHMAEETFSILAPFGSDSYEYLFEYPTAGRSDVGIDFGSWSDHESGPGLRSAGGRMMVKRYVMPAYYGVGESATGTFLSGIRGGAGYLGVARTEYTTHFGTAGGGAGSTTAAQRTKDTTPPSKPVIQFKVGDEWTSGGADTWLPDPTRLEVRWLNAYDAESGIAEYEYSIGYRDQPASVLPWTSAGGRTSLVIQGADLKEDAGYFIFARARNGEGLWSEVAHSGYFQVDLTPPVFPAGIGITVERVEVPDDVGVLPGGGGGLAGPGGAGRPGGLAGIGSGFAPVLTPEEQAALFPAAACAVPAPTFMHQAPATFSVRRAQVSAGAPVPAKPVRIYFPGAEDRQSRVASYYWRLVDEASGGSFTTTDGWHELDAHTSGFDIESSILESGSGRFVSIIAVNGAGLPSEPIVGSVMPEDITPPIGTAFCAGQHSAPGQLFLALSSAAVDPESGIRGYQYRVRGEGETLIRDWGESLETMDFTNLAAGSKVITTPLPLSDGASYYVDLRAINNHGLREVVTSGPIVVDFSPPPAPSAEVLRVLDYTPPLADAGGEVDPNKITGIQDQLTRLLPVRLEVRVVAPDDPHTGILTHQWEVVPAKDIARLQVVTAGGTSTDQVGGGQGGTGGGGLGGLLGAGAGGLLGGGAGGLLGGGGSTTSSPPHGSIPGAQAGTYTVILTSQEMLELNKAAPGTQYELRIRTINGAGVVSAIHKARFTLPGAEAKRAREETKKGAGQ